MNEFGFCAKYGVTPTEAKETANLLYALLSMTATLMILETSHTPPKRGPSVRRNRSMSAVLLRKLQASKFRAITSGLV